MKATRMLLFTNEGNVSQKHVTFAARGAIVALLHLVAAARVGLNAPCKALWN